MLGIKEKIQALICRIEWFKYERKKHFYAVIILCLLLVVGIFSVVLVNQQKEIKVKQNILKSFYSNEKNVSDGDKNHTEGSSPGSSNYGKNSDSYLSLEENGQSEDNKFSGERENGVENGKEDSSMFNQVTDNTSQDTSKMIKVYICGCVVNPDVYEVRDGSRIVDVLDLAGGPTNEACLEAINLASLVVDGQKIYVPSFDEISQSEGIVFGDSNSYEIFGNQEKTVNINCATKKELESLPGIGSVLAQNIIDYRNKYGLFKSKEEIKKVKGIGEKKYEEIRELISV